MKPKKMLFIVMGIVVVAAIICAASGQFSNIAQANSAPTPTPEVTSQPAVRARGKVIPARHASLSFETSGELVKWLVQEGDTVEVGQLLGELDTTQAQLALAQAEAELASAQANLTRAEKQHRYETEEARLQLSTAEAQLTQQRVSYPDLTEATIQVERAEKALADANEAYRRAADTPGLFKTPGVQDHYQEKIDQARQDLEIARAAYATARGNRAATSQQVAAREDDVARAQLRLEKLEAGIDPTLKQAVEKAKLQLQEAQEALDACTLTAPFAGTVVLLEARERDWVQPGTPVLIIADLERLQVETTDLDEWGATHIQPGDEAEITFNAFDDLTLTGQVQEIALHGEELSSGDVAYPTIITLDAPEARLRWGMTVRVSIPLEEE